MLNLIRQSCYKGLRSGYHKMCYTGIKEISDIVCMYIIKKQPVVMNIWVLYQFIVIYKCFVVFLWPCISIINLYEIYLFFILILYLSFLIYLNLLTSILIGHSWKSILTRHAREEWGHNLIWCPPFNYICMKNTCVCVLFK